MADQSDKMAGKLFNAPKSVVFDVVSPISPTGISEIKDLSITFIYIILSSIKDLFAQGGGDSCDKAPTGQNH
jgi:hypothetical protein